MIDFLKRHATVIIAAVIVTVLSFGLAWGIHSALHPKSFRTAPFFW